MDQPVCGRRNSVKETSTFVGSGHAAGIHFAEQSIADFGDAAIAEITQGGGDDPQQSSADPPESAQQKQNAADGGGMSVQVAVVTEHD
jgi:hypothetical protein